MVVPTSCYYSRYARWAWLCSVAGYTNGCARPRWPMLDSIWSNVFAVCLMWLLGPLERICRETATFVAAPENCCWSNGGVMMKPMALLHHSVTPILHHSIS